MKIFRGVTTGGAGGGAGGSRPSKPKVAVLVMIDADDLDDLIAALPSGALYEAISDRGAWEARARFLTLAQETGTWLAGGGKGHAQVQET